MTEVSEIDGKALESGGYPLRHRKQLTAMFGPSLEMAQKHLPKILKGDALLILVGDRGPGKTQISTWWAAQRTLHDKSSGRYVKCADIISEIKSTWHDGGKSIGTENDVLRKYRSTSFLVIDEFHERGASEWEARTLINLLDHRYDDMKATVLIANIAVQKLEEAINKSIIDRANQTGGVIECNWPSYRL